jgi:hypothetical protein
MRFYSSVPEATRDITINNYFFHFNTYPSIQILHHHKPVGSKQVISIQKRYILPEFDCFDPVLRTLPTAPETFRAKCYISMRWLNVTFTQTCHIYNRDTICHGTRPTRVTPYLEVSPAKLYFAREFISVILRIDISMFILVSSWSLVIFTLTEFLLLWHGVVKRNVMW